MLELRTLGSPAIHDPRNGLLTSSPKPLALLVYLALAQPRGPQQRDTLLALFYPDLDHEHARMALRQLVYALRAVVGAAAVRADRHTVALEAGTLTCDVLAVEAALAADDPAKAAAAYRGAFLSGFFLSGCPEFEQWVESERSRLQRAYVGALERLALAADAAGDAQEAVRLWGRLAEADPYATRVAVRLMAALDVAGDRAAALEVAARHAARLEAELGAAPSPEIEALARRLRAQPAPRTPRPGGSTRERLAAAVAGRYRVTEVAGAGAMALVYRAEDLKLGRLVALKVLRPELAEALGRERFLNEVDIAAGLAHPNILPLHDAGAADGLLYYVMPYVEGESLRARLAREGPLGFGEAVRIAREVAEALAYAHGRGIVHRDIKPANILLLADHAVVSDFGVARAIGTIIEDPAFVAATGTPAYMSPEQASGSPDVDGRSDLYSLGCVLHEMLTGAPPDGATDPAAALATRPSPTLPGTSAARQAVPQPIVRAMRVALATNPADRFGTAEEFVTALKADTPSRFAVGRKLVRPAVGALAATALLAIAVDVREVARPFTITAETPRRVTFDPGMERAPAISPDGSQVAYITGEDALELQSLSGGPPLHLSDDAGRPQWSPDGERIFFGGWTGRGSLYAIKEISRTGGAVRILDRPMGYNPTISPDGTRIAYRWTWEGDGQGIYIQPVGGGPERGEPAYIIPETGVIHSMRWSPDGRRIAWVRSPNRVDPRRGAALIANELATSAIWVTREGSQPVQVTEDAHRDLSPVWLPDNRHLLFVSDRSGPRDIYVLDADDPGQPQRLTFGEDPGWYLSVSADGKRLAYSKYRFRRNVWSVPIPERGVGSIGEPRPVTAAGWDQLILWHDLSPDGDTIALDFRAHAGGESHIYKMALGGGVPVQLTSHPAADYRPVWSPDGREIAFAREGRNGAELWVMDADGGYQRREAEGLGGQGHYDWSPDGLQLIYERGEEGLWAVSRDSLRQGWDSPVEFGDPAVWYEGECQLPRRVPGGSGIVCNAFHERSPLEPFNSLLWLSPRGQVERRYHPTGFEEANRKWNAVILGDTTDPDILWWIRHARYSPDGSTVYFFGNPGGEVFVMSMPAEGGEPRRVAPAGYPSLFSWSPEYDGRGPAALTVGRDSLYLSLGEAESDIWVMDLEW